MVEEKDVAQQIYGQIVLKAWEDPEFKKKLASNPKETLKEIGLNLPEHLHLHIHFQTENNIHLIIPEKPKELGELSSDEMRKFAGGYDVFKEVF